MTSLSQIGKQYQIILADPPWRYDFSRSDSRQVENQYETMTPAEIMALPVQSITAQKATLFLWTTSPKLDIGINVLKAWGFEYKTCGIWVKDKIGMGYYFRQQHEIVLVGTKGNPPVAAPATRPSSVFDGRREQHSKKPAILHRYIERMYPGRTKIELFARAGVGGWDTWGNEHVHIEPEPTEDLE